MDADGHRPPPSIGRVLPEPTAGRRLLEECWRQRAGRCETRSDTFSGRIDRRLMTAPAKAIQELAGHASAKRCEHTTADNPATTHAKR